MKKTLLITLDFPPKIGGVATYLGKMCAGLPADKLVVLADRSKNNFLFDEKQAYKIYRHRLLSKLSWPRWYRMYKLAKEIVKKEEIEQVLISHVLPVGYVARLLKLPYLVICHGYDVKAAEANPWKEFWLERILKKAKQVVVNSAYTAELVESHEVNPEIIKIIHPGPSFDKIVVDQENVTKIKAKYKLDGKRVLLSIGRLVERKGFDMVIHALPDLVAEFPNLVYLIVGEGNYQLELLKMVKKLKLEDHVYITGKVADKDIMSYYQLADVFAMVSRQVGSADVEGFGIVYLDANLFELPVIAGDSGGVKDAVIDGQTGLLVDPENLDKIKQAIYTLLANSELAQNLGRQGKLRVEENFRWTDQAEKLKELLS